MISMISIVVYVLVGIFPGLGTQTVSSLSLDECKQRRVAALAQYPSAQISDCVPLMVEVPRG